MFAIYPIPVMVLAVIVSLVFSHKIKAMPVVAAGITCGVLLLMRVISGEAMTTHADLLLGLFLVGLGFYMMARQEGKREMARGIATIGATVIAFIYVLLGVMEGGLGPGISFLAILLFIAAYVASGVLWRGGISGKR